MRCELLIFMSERRLCLQADADTAFAIPADQLLKVELPYSL